MSSGAQDWLLASLAGIAQARSHAVDRQMDAAVHPFIDLGRVARGCAVALDQLNLQVV
jgi:hypothetical protein